MSTVAGESTPALLLAWIPILASRTPFSSVPSLSTPLHSSKSMVPALSGNGEESDGLISAKILSLPASEDTTWLSYAPVIRSPIAVNIANTRNTIRTLTPVAPEWYRGSSTLASTKVGLTGSTVLTNKTLLSSMCELLTFDVRFGWYSHSPTLDSRSGKNLKSMIIK